MKDLEKHLSDLETHAALLETERAQADALFLSIGDGAITTDEHGKINRINRATTNLLGFSEEDLLGKWFPKVIVAYDDAGNIISPMNRPITKAFLRGEPISDKHRIRRKDGELLPVSITVSPILIGGRPIGAIEVFRDYSVELELEKMKDEFISLASHQLRTPLTAIKMYTELLMHGFAGDLTPDQEKYMKIIHISVRRMNHLINTLLNIAKIEAGNIAIQPKATRLHYLVRDIINELQPQLALKKIMIHTDIEKLPAIVTDPMLVKEILANLLTNAIKYTPKNGDITIAINIVGTNIAIAITDTGYGIPKHEQNRVFTKFYRASNITKKSAGGTGLGLYMVKRLAESLGGEITFSSREKAGSTFTVTLPYLTEQDARQLSRLAN